MRMASLGTQKMHDESSADAIVAMAYDFRRAKVLMAAVELDVFTILGDGALDSHTLIARIGIAERGAHDFLDALVALQLLHRDCDGRYSNTVAAALYLDRRQSGYVGGMVVHLDQREYPRWQSLTAALRSGRPQADTQTLSSTEFFADEQQLETFAGGMSGGSFPAAQAIARKFPWREFTTVVDVGTSEGCLLVQLAHPHIRGWGFDRPQYKPIFDRYVAKYELADRLSFRGGDFFTDPLPGASVLVMGRILNNWDLVTKQMLVAKAHAALAPGGALIVYERFIDNARRTHSAGLLSSLNMLLMTEGGFDFTAEDCMQWMDEAGFRECRLEPLTADIGMLVATK